MRKIILEGIQYPDKRSARTIDRKYRIYFGNHTFYAFKTKLSAEVFLTEASEALNDKFIQLNEILIDARTLYQRHWVFFDKHTEIEKNILQHFSMIDTAMLFMINFSGGDKNAWIFQKFPLIINGLQETLSSLADMMRKRSNYYEVRRMDIHIDNLYEFRNFINDFWKDHPGYVPPEKLSIRR